jgi:hypothetical protein
MVCQEGGSGVNSQMIREFGISAAELALKD